jgi:signal transduction histidine kinase
MESISTIGLNKNQLNALLQNILEQLATSVQTDMALIGKIDNDFNYEKILSIGAIEEKINLDELIARVKNIPLAKDEVVQLDELVLARMDKYSVFAVLKKQEKLQTEKMYLLKLFVQNAAQAIRNAELNEKLVQNEKLSAIGQVIGMVMHDLRSPIKNIQLLTGMLRDDGHASTEIDLIDQSAKQASEIFDDFLDFINQMPVKKIPVNLGKITSAAIEQAQAVRADVKVVITNNISPDLVIPGDESKLRRVVVNLVNNAIDALHDNKVQNAAITLEASIKDHEAVLTIADNGPGITPEITTTLFEPFVTKNKTKGTGLGLAIVKQYISSHGGKIKVANNNGAVFTINLPL